jgi:ferredoxin
MASERKALPAIEPSRCTGCGWCVAACPPRVLSLEAAPQWRKVSTLHDAPNCTGCALCAVKCPFDAIAMVKRSATISA